MATVASIEKKIKVKTFLTFLVCFFILLAISFFYAFFSYNQNIYHLQFFNKYLLNQTFYVFFNNFFYTSMIAIVFCFAVVIGRGDVISSDGKRLFFHQIVTPGLFFLIFLSLIYITSTEIILPKIDTQLTLLSNSTHRANMALQISNELFDENDYENCIKYYQEYLSIIEDSRIEERLREAKNKINIPKSISSKYFEATLQQIKSKSDKEFLNDMYQKNINNIRYLKTHLSEQERQRIWSTLNAINFFGGDYSVEGQFKYANIDTTIADNITNYSDLANIYFDRHDFLTAWFYYQYTVEKHIPESKFAKDRINKIKQTFKEEHTDLTDEEFDRYIKETEKQIMNIYYLQAKANRLLADNQYQKAFFVYSDILNFNPNLRDASVGKNASYNLLQNIGANLKDVIQSKNYPGKSNISFLIEKNKLISVDTIIEVYDMATMKNNYYLYGINIYEYDDNKVLQTKLSAKYGEIKNGVTGTLYCYNLVDKNEEYFPTQTLYTPDGEILCENEIQNNFLFIIPIDIQIIYHLSYDYQKALSYSLLKLFKLTNVDKNISIPTTLNKYEYEVILKNRVKKQTANILDSIYYYNEKQMNYQIRKDTKKIQFENLKSALFSENIFSESTSLGINKQFINAAICDKICRMFLFLIIGILLITISWKLKSTTIGMLPIATIPFLILIPLFVYSVVKVLFMIQTAIISTLVNMLISNSGIVSGTSFNILLVSLIFVYSILLLGSTILLAVNKAE